MRTAPRILGKASELPSSQRFCTCCEQPLKGKIAWLELDQRTYHYHDFGDVPVDKSQGWFAFGLTCAKNKLAEASLRKFVEVV
jgi:hypothetical protein